MISLSGAYTKIYGAFEQFFKPLTREEIRKTIRAFDSWREYTIDPSAFPEAIAMAERAVEHTEVGVRADGLELFYTLVRDFQQDLSASYEPATKAAFVAVGDADSGIQIKGLEILEELVSHRHYVPAYEPATKAAQAVIRDLNSNVRAQGLELYRVLILSRHEPAYEPAIKAALVAIDDRANWGVIRRCSGLLSAFFHIKYVQAYPAAITVAHIAASHECADVRRGGVMLLAELVEKGYEPAYSEAIQAAQAAVVAADVALRRSGFYLFERLVKAGYADAYEPAKIVAQEAVVSADACVCRDGLSLFETLVKAGYADAYESAKVAAQKAVISADVDVYRAGLSLFGALVEAGYADAYKSAKVAAQEPERVVYNADRRHYGMDLDGDSRRYGREILRKALQEYEKRRSGRS